MNDLLTKLFVLVPAGTPETLDNIKAKSLTNKKIYFIEDLNQIVLNGITYGVDPKSSKEIVSLINAIGGSVADDGTVTVDFKDTHFASEASNIVAAIVALDTTLNGELVKLSNSKTLDENYEFTGSIKYVAAVPAAEGKDAVPAHIALFDEDDTELSSIPVSDIIGNGVLKSSSYDAATGILTLTFAQADGTEKPINVDLKAMLDINDISIAEDSKKYLEVTLGTAEVEGETQAVFGAKVKKIVGASESADLTGLADAADVKAYVDSKAIDLAITANGDDYVKASVNADVNKKHVIVDANVQDVTYTAGTHATYDGEGAVKIQATPAYITGVANSLVDGAQAITAIKSYIDFVAEEEALRADNKVLAVIKGLDVTAQTKGTNVHVTVSETDGKVALDSVVEDYATVTPVRTSSRADAPATDASLTVAEGDEDKLVKASDLKAVAAYAADKVTEEEHRVDKKIKDLTSYATGADTGNYISVRVDSTSGKVSDVTVKFDPWETYGGTTA